MEAVDLEMEAKRRLEVAEWLNSLFPNLSLPLEASEEELRACLADGTVLRGIVDRLHCSPMEEAFMQSGGDKDCSSEQWSENVKLFLSAVDELGLPGFKPSDLEKGSLFAVLECLLSLRDQFNLGIGEDSAYDAKTLANYGSPSRKSWNLLEADRVEEMDFSQGVHGQRGQKFLLSGEESRKNISESKFQHVLRSSIISEPSAALLHHVGHKFHEIFQLKQGRYSDLSAAKISEMMKSNNLDNAPIQSLLNVVHGILDESIERKNGEISHRIACLLKKVVQEIERRISTQAEHIRNQNNLIKACEEKYQSRIRILETLVSGTSGEIQIVMNQLQHIKTEKSNVEERRKHEEQDVVRLTKEKENCDHIISELKQEIEEKNKLYEQQCLQLETSAKEAKEEFEKRLKENMCLLEESRRRTEELEAFSESEAQKWNKKEHMYQNFVNLQLLALQDLRALPDSIKKEVRVNERCCLGELTNMEARLKEIAAAAEGYHTVLAENRKLYNEVQELKGNIRVYCRIRPFLSSQKGKLTTIDYIGENGELVIVNSLKQGKDSHRTFKFNKVFGLAASQEEVFLDTQPLIRSVLDGYNVCIFAYGQTGSGKTYTMSGPNASSKENWGVNYRALDDLFHISRNRRNTFMYEVGVQMVEIYNEQVRDLLSSDAPQKSLGIWSITQPNGLAVPDASMHVVNSTSDVLELMQTGHANRAVGATALNERSSRSHSVLTVHIRGTDLESGVALRGSLHLVDLAGSERVDRSEATGDRLKEAQHINKSLSALGDVIFALAQKSPHVPYRNSKLTQVLQSSLGGQAKTLMFVQINPDVESYSETISTLKFAERVSGVELGAARSNKEGKDVREFIEQVASLKDTIARKDEEIERLQLLKDRKTQSPSVNIARQGRNSLRHSSSSPGRLSPGVSTQRGRKVSGGRPMRHIDKATSDLENCSEPSDKHSETSSLQSMEDFKQHKENLHHSQYIGGEMGQNSSADIDLLGFGDADSEERLSDISDSGLSMGTETDGSISSIVEFTLFPEVSKPEENTAEKTPKVPSRIPRPPVQNLGQTPSAQAKLVSQRSQSRSQRSATGQAPSSSAKASKKWH